jgi:hypothetical protein
VTVVAVGVGTTVGQEVGVPDGVGVTVLDGGVTVLVGVLVSCGVSVMDGVGVPVSGGVGVIDGVGVPVSGGVSVTDGVGVPVSGGVGVIDGVGVLLTSGVSVMVGVVVSVGGVPAQFAVPVSRLPSSKIATTSITE